MADGTRLSQMQKDMDLMSCQMGEFAEVKTQVEELRTQMMALTASMTSIASNVSTLLKDKASGSDQGETHKGRYADFPREKQHHNEESPRERQHFNDEIPRERQHYNEEEYYGGYRKYKFRGKMDFPKFEGENPADWLYKAKQYFLIHETHEDDKIPMASFHLEGVALTWFQDAEGTPQVRTWDAFCWSCMTRFGPTAYDDPMEAMMRLKQTSNVAVYKAEFEVLSNRLRNLTPEYKLSCFLSGLNEEIRLPVRLLAPTNLLQAFALAKIQEEYVATARKTFKPYYMGGDRSYGHNSGKGTAPFTQGGSSNFGQFSKKDEGQNALFRKPNSTLPIQRVSSAVMKERRSKGLCYTCDEKWNLAHVCKSPKIYMMHGGEIQQADYADDVFFFIQLMV
jgi:hypothetical protein